MIISESTRPIQRSLTVIKTGGSLEGGEFYREVAEQLSKLDGNAVIVNGGGREIDQLCSRLSVRSEKKNGLRITTPEVLEAVTMALAKKAMEFASVLCSGGITAIPMPALSFCTSERRKEYGLVGGKSSVDVELLMHLVSKAVPVIYPISRGGEQLLNVNADELAADIAVAAGASALILLTDIDGVILNGKVVESISAGDSTIARKLRVE